MRRILFAAMFALVAVTAGAQKFALIDMEYILKNIPAYERADEQLNQVAKKWQAEVDALNTEASTMYKNYQNEVVFLSQEQKQARQQEINDKEKQAAELKRKYFGPDGELFKKRTSLMTPIQEEIYNAERREGHLRPAWLFPCARPRVRHGHHLRLAAHRHQQRSVVKIRLFKLKTASFVC